MGCNCGGQGRQARSSATDLSPAARARRAGKRLHRTDQQPAPAPVEQPAGDHRAQQPADAGR